MYEEWQQKTLDQYLLATPEQLAAFQRHREKEQAEWDRNKTSQERHPEWHDAFRFHHWLRDEAHKVESENLRTELAETDPATVAAFDSDVVAGNVGIGSLGPWLHDYRWKQRVERLQALGISKIDADMLALLSDETRARLLLDGKSIP